MAVVVKAGKLYSLCSDSAFVVRVSRVSKDLVRWYPRSGGGPEHSTAMDLFLSQYVEVGKEAQPLDTN